MQCAGSSHGPKREASQRRSIIGTSHGCSATEKEHNDKTAGIEEHRAEDVGTGREGIEEHFEEHFEEEGGTEEEEG